MDFARVYQNTVAILTNHADQNVLVVKNVQEIKPASEINVEIHAQECVVKMRNVTLLIIFRLALAWLTSPVIHLHTVAQLKLLQIKKIRVILPHVDQIAFVEMLIIQLFARVLKDSKDPRHHADRNAL